MRNNLTAEDAGCHALTRFVRKGMFHGLQLAEALVVCNRKFHGWHSLSRLCAHRLESLCHQRTYPSFLL